jgi:O-antigen ligase
MNDQVATWGLPYFIGRLYFRTLDDLRELAIGLFIGGLIYVPFCLYEIKMSPQLHRIVYGYLQHSWGQTKRFGGWRPMVFMQHGLMVGMWMCMTALVGFWLWITGSLRRLGGWPVALLVAVLILTALLCKSFGAIALLAGGMAVFASIWMWRTRWLLWALIAAAPAYMVARAGFDWHPDTPLAIVTAVAGPDRAESWQTRIDSEDDFIRAAWQKPFTGWRHWFDTKPLWTGSRAIPDGLWTTILVQMGFPALLAFVLMLLLPVVLFVRRYRPQSWLRVDIAPAAALAMVLVLYLIDCVSNAMVNPLFTLVAGGLASVVTARVDVLASASAPATRRAKPILNLPSIRQPRTQ